MAFYRTWRGAGNAKLDGTNPKGWSSDHNVTEQAEGGASASVIGQCVKERYRTMRGYKRKASILNVSSVIGWARAHGNDGDLSELVSK